MKEVFIKFLETIIKELKAERPSIPFYHDDDGEIDDDRYQDALEVSYELPAYDEQIDEVVDCLDNFTSIDDMDQPGEIYIQALQIINKHGYKITIHKTF